MDKETLSNYGWVVICIIVLVIMIALATPFGNFVRDAVAAATNAFGGAVASKMSEGGVAYDGPASLAKVG